MSKNKKLTSIKLDDFSVLGYRVMSRYSKMNKSYEEYKFMTDVALDILDHLPKEMLKELVKSDFLLPKDKMNV
jgi:hypothetical protein